MIEINQLVKSFGKQPVLKIDEFIIQPGDRIALIGANGAGKTTLIRSILGQYQAKGTITVFGKNPRKSRVPILDRIGFVPQHSPPLQMSVRELINFTVEISPKSEQKEIEKIAVALGMDIRENEKKPFVKLSGGMQQKMLISLALAKKPDLLIMDEPAANLDPIGRKAFFHELGKLAQDTTMLLSSHRVDEVLSLINRIVEMDLGKIVVDEKIGTTRIAHDLLPCSIELLDENQAATRALQDWGFKPINGETYYEGSIAGADRLRFINSISHFANAISKLKIN